MRTQNQNVNMIVRWVLIGILSVGLASCAKKKTVPEETDIVEVTDVEEVVVDEAAPTSAQSLDLVFFDFDRSSLKPDARATIKSNYATISTMPNATVLIEGYCDERGTVEYNLALGQRRADSVREYLISLGASSSQVSTISYGKANPLDPGHDEAAWAKNRRAATLVNP